MKVEVITRYLVIYKIQSNKLTYSSKDPTAKCVEKCTYEKTSTYKSSTVYIRPGMELVIIDRANHLRKGRALYYFFL